MAISRSRVVLIGFVVLLVGVAVAVYAMISMYPKPQILSAAGQSAPDFTLPDQDGKPFTLSAQRGRPVLVYFYRGYW